MGFIGDLAKAILISWVFFWVLALAWFLSTGQLGMASLFLVGLLIPLAFVAYEYRNYRKSNQHR